MVKYCSVPRCLSGRKKNEKVTVFQVPENAAGQWSKILQCELTSTNFVCEKHFPKSAIRDVETIEWEGKVIFEVIPIFQLIFPTSAHVFVIQEQRDCL